MKVWYFCQHGGARVERDGSNPLLKIQQFVSFISILYIFNKYTVHTADTVTVTLLTLLTLLTVFTLLTLIAMLAPLTPLTLLTLFKQLLGKRAIVPIQIELYGLLCKIWDWTGLRILRLLPYL